jgi:hypothetical protein
METKVLPTKLSLKPGHFYKDRQGTVWCCYRVRNQDPKNDSAADCIRIDDERVEYFYLDGRYDSEGLRELCLVEEVTP